LSPRPRYDLFFTHAWRYHDDWNHIVASFDAEPGLRWRNFSVPWHDPAVSPNSPDGGVFVRHWLESQIVPVHAVVLLAGVWSQESSRKWLELELELARKHGKPVIVVPASGEMTIAPDVAAKADRVASWQVSEILDAVDALRGTALLEVAL
jgi:hypothetical protein